MINHDIWRFPAQIGGTPIDRWFLWTGKCQKNGWWFGGSPISGNYYTILYKILLQYGLLWEFPEILEAYHPILIRTENWKPWMPWMPWTLASTFFGWLGPSSSSSSRVWHQWTLRLHAFFFRFEIIRSTVTSWKPSSSWWGYPNRSLVFVFLWKCRKMSLYLEKWMMNISEHRGSPSLWLQHLQEPLARAGAQGVVIVMVKGSLLDWVPIRWK